MDTKNLIDPQENPELNMGAHDPKVDLARNKNLFKKSLYVAGAFVLILIIICTLQYFGNSSAKTDISQADYAFVTASDSASSAKAMQMYNQVANNSSATSAQRAKIISAGDAYAKGEYKKALEFIQDVKTQSPVVQTLKYCLEGDCYINLDQTDKGIAAFQAAIDEANDNPELAPYALTKLSNAYSLKGDYKNQLEVLNQILYKFPSYNPQIEAEIARAQALTK